MFARKIRSAASLLIGGGLLLITVFGLGTPGLIPWVDADVPASATTVECSVEFLALDPTDQTKNNPDKEVPGAFGPAAASFTDEAVIKDDLAERRNCGEDGRFDPALTAAHYLTWSEAGRTSRSVKLAQVDEFRAEIAGNPTLYREVTDELTKLENASAFSITSGIPAGAKSLYMTPDGAGNALVKSGSVIPSGTSAVFTHGDKVINYRLDCGYQPWWPPGNEPPLPPECMGDECVPPPPPPPPVCPWNPSVPPESPECLQPKNSSESSVYVVEEWIRDGDTRHSVSNGDGATVPNGIQHDPEGDARRAAEEAARQQQQQQQQHQEAQREAEQSGGGTVDNNQNNGGVSNPGW